jgi:hypothetical protein
MSNAEALFVLPNDLMPSAPDELVDEGDNGREGGAEESEAVADEDVEAVDGAEDGGVGVEIRRGSPLFEGVESFPLEEDVEGREGGPSSIFSSISKIDCASTSLFSQPQPVTRLRRQLWSDSEVNFV